MNALLLGPPRTTTRFEPIAGKRTRVARDSCRKRHDVVPKGAR